MLIAPLVTVGPNWNGEMNCGFSLQGNNTQQFFFKKEKTTDLHDHVDKSQKYYAKRKKPDARVCSVRFHVYDAHEQES